MNFRVQINLLEEGQVRDIMQANSIDELFTSIFSQTFIKINNTAYAVSRITSVKAQPQ